MAQFDVHRLGDGLVIDCQADLLGHLASRLVVPLVPRDEAPKPATRLNPVFAIDGRDHVMITESASAVDRRELGPTVTSLAGHSIDITSAIDFLTGGF